MNETKLKVGLSMLSEARDGEFDSATSILNKLLGNVVAQPSEPKFRKLRASNPKIGAMLATKGVRALLIGAGFTEQGEFLVLADDAPVDGVQAALEGVAADAARRSSANSTMKEMEQAKRKADAEKENEERKRMMAGIADDAAARKEPGWTAKAAGVKDGRSIVSCGDIGAQGSAGG